MPEQPRRASGLRGRGPFRDSADSVSRSAVVFSHRLNRDRMKWASDDAICFLFADDGIPACRDRLPDPHTTGDLPRRRRRA